jgi:mannose-6-phosphate isomerase-like protein (cupin superfamily)
MTDDTKPFTGRHEAVNLAAGLASLDELWAQRTVAHLNDYEVKLAKLHGEFVWHRHDDTDELFLVISGRLTIQLRDGGGHGDRDGEGDGGADRVVVLGPGELFVVPKGAEHCPRADEETAILLLEPAGTLNTGDAGGSRTKVSVPLTP